MKKILQFALSMAAIATTLTFNSCDKLKSVVKTPDVSFTGASTDLVIPPTSDTSEQVEWGAIPITFNIDSMIKAETSGVVGFNSIKSVKITSLTLTLIDGTSTNNFANFVIAGAEFNTNANNYGYDAYILANVDNNPDSYSLTLSPPVVSTTEDIKKYFSASTTFVYAVKGQLRRPITDSLHCHVDVTYDIGF